MKKYFRSLLAISAMSLLIVSCTNSNAEASKRKDAYWVKKCAGEYNDSCGYADTSGRFMIPPGKYSFCFTDTFRNMAIVLDSGFVGINRKGEKLFNVVGFDNGPDEFSEGLVRIQKGDKMGFADADGNIVITPRFGFVWRFSDGLATFSNDCRQEWDDTHEHRFLKGGKWGYVNKKGEVAIAAHFDHANDFVNGEAEVVRNDTTYVIDKTGKILRRK